MPELGLGKAMEMVHSRTRMARSTDAALALGVLITAMLILAPFLAVKVPFSIHSNARLSLDEGTYLYEGLRVAKGELPYRDFFTFVGPVPVYILGIVFRVFGPALVAARALHFLLLSASAVGLFRIARRLGLSSLGASLLAVSSVLGITAVWPIAYHHWVAVSLGILALDQTTKALEEQGGHSTIRMVITGGLAGACVLSVQSYGLPLCAALLVSVAIQSLSAEGPDGLKTRHFTLTGAGPFYFLVGVLSVIVPAVFLFAIAGGLQEMFYDCWVWPFHHYVAMNRAPYGSDVGVYTGGVTNWPLWSGSAARAFIYLQIAVPILAVIFSIVMISGTLFGGLFHRLIPPQDSNLGPSLAVSLWAIAVLLPLFVGQTRADMAHVTFAGFGTILAVWCPVSHLRTRRLRVLMKRVIMALIFVLFVTTCIVWLHRQRESTVSPADFSTADDAARASAGAEVFSDFVGAEGSVVKLGWSSGWLHFYGPPSISPYTLLLPPSTGYNTLTQWAEVANLIVNRRPALVMVSPEGYMTLLQAVPDIDEMYDYHPWLAVAGDHLKEKSGESRWVVVHSDYFKGVMNLSHYGSRVVGEVAFGSGTTETVFGTVGDGSVRLIRVWPNGFYQTHLGPLDENGSHASGVLFDVYGVTSRFEMTRMFNSE